MADRSSSQPPARLAERTGPLFWATVLLIVTAPLWLLCGLVLAVLVTARPLIVYPLAFATMGGIGAGLWFAYIGAWTDAAQAAAVVVISGGLLMVYLVVVDRFEPVDVRERFHPPWWWYF